MSIDPPTFVSSSEGIIRTVKEQVADGQHLSLKEVLYEPTERLGLQAFEIVHQLEGAILALAFVHDAEQHVFGTAVLIAPGIAFSAGHVIREHMQSGHFEGADAAIYGLGPSPERLHIWRVADVTYSLEGDVAVLVFEYATDLPKHLSLSFFACCARAPEIGEPAATLGFRALADRPVGELEGAFLTSSGSVTDVWIGGRDAMLPRPSFAAATVTIGAMSGGAVVNGKGKLIGIITSSIDAYEDQPAITFSTLIWVGLMTVIRPRWPPKFWSDEPASVLSLIFVEDSWRLHWSEKTGTFRYQQGGVADTRTLRSF